MVVRHILSITNSYMNIKQKQFGHRLEIATPNLVTFLKYDNVGITNNAAERKLRELVVHRKVRGQMINEKGIRVFDILLTCYLTWKECDLSIKEMLLKCLRGSNCVRLDTTRVYNLYFDSKSKFCKNCGCSPDEKNS